MSDTERDIPLTQLVHAPAPTLAPVRLYKSRAATESEETIVLISSLNATAATCAATKVNHHNGPRTSRYHRNSSPLHESLPAHCRDSLRALRSSYHCPRNKLRTVSTFPMFVVLRRREDPCGLHSGGTCHRNVRHLLHPISHLSAKGQVQHSVMTACRELSAGLNIV